MESTCNDWLNLNSSVPTVNLNLRGAWVFLLQFWQSIATCAIDWRTALLSDTPSARRSKLSVALTGGCPKFRGIVQNYASVYIAMGMSVGFHL